MHSSSLLNWLGNKFFSYSRKILTLANSDFSDHTTDYFVLERQKLLEKISRICSKQKNKYKHFSYFYDYTYQSFATIGVFGERSTEERFDRYQLKKYINKDHKILDLGCNCGFMSIYASFRTGCHMEGIDINPYAIEIGNECSKFLRVSDSVNLEEKRVQDLDLNKKYDGVFSFATHWTDDKNYRVSIDDHFSMIHKILNKDGYLYFESHAADVGNDEFYNSINNIIKANLFKKVFETDSDAGARHYFIFQKTT